MANSNQTVIQGTQLRMKLEFDYIGDSTITFDKLTDISIKFYCDDTNYQTFSKDDIIFTEDGDKILLVDTSKVGRGRLMVRMECGVPDTEAEGGYRKEIAEGDTNVVIKR